MPAPAILTTDGFGGSTDDQADLGQAFAERGYVAPPLQNSRHNYCIQC
jgi:hypothetical protein